MTNINRDRRLGQNGHHRQLSAYLRRTLEHATAQKGHSLRKRLQVSCDMAPRDINPLMEAARELYWQPVEHAQDVISNDERPEVQAFIKWVEEAPDELGIVFASFLDLIACAAFLEGWIAGTIAVFEKGEARQRAANRRPGR